MAAPEDRLRILGADANNLRDVDLDIPFGSLTVVTGVSGSGKSSFLAQTLAAEGARRNAVFLGLSQPGLEEDEPRAFIGPMPPTALVGQRGFRPSIRTTVATATGLLTLLRRLFVLEAAVWSDVTNQPVQSPSPETYAGWLARHYRGDIEILASPLRMQKADGVRVVRRLAAHGVEMVRIYSETDPIKLREVGREVSIEAFKPLNPNTAHSIEASFGRQRVTGPDSEPTLRKSFEDAFAAGNGAVVVTLTSSDDPALISPYGPRLDSLRNWVHPEDPATYLPASRHLLSFNAPSHADSGACPTCGGTGVASRIDLDALVAHPERSMAQGAFSLWTTKNYKHLNIQHETIAGLAGLKGFDPHRPWRDLPASARDLVLYGSLGQATEDRDENGRRIGAARPFRGFAPILIEKAAASRSAQHLSQIVVSGQCPACEGARWSPQAKALRVASLSIADLLAKSFAELADLCRADGPLSVVRSTEARGLVAAARKRAEDVVQVGLPYLTADRSMLGVSDGESRRLRLARVLAPDQTGFCLLLDEPGRGLHEADLGHLGEALARLRGRHTVVINEHRKSLWPVADRLIAFGPGAGPSGGLIVQDGPPPLTETNSASLRALMPPPGPDKNWVRIDGIRHHNIQDAKIDIPTGRLTTICGVSGSGKSSFVQGVLIPALTGTADAQGRWRSIAGQSHLGDLVVLDQAVPSPNRRSIVATLTGTFDAVRRAFSASQPALREKLGPSDFGLNAGHGRCPVCEGVGSVEAEGRAAPCPACGGARYGPAVLSVRVHGKNIRELLDTPVDRLPPDLRLLTKADMLLDLMGDLGIGHVALGRRIDTLSGGELQRLRLAVRLASSNARSTFIMDEPAAGLHERDVHTLIGALDRALGGGRNTIIVVEHDLEIIRASDWLVEFGPGSGPQGGDVVFQGVAADFPSRKTPTALALSGRLAPVEPARHAPKPAPPGKLSPSEGADQARRTLAALRTITTGDVPSAEDYDPAADGASRPSTVMTSDRLWSGRDPSEAAGLERQVAKVLLDLHYRARDDAQSELLEAWALDTSAFLRIHPFVEGMRNWGPRLPQSVIRERLNHLRAEGLELSKQTTHGLEVQDVGSVRATGPRFAPPVSDQDARLSVLADALVIGGGYVELCTQAGTVKATAGRRLLSPPKGLVAPLAPMPQDFSRHETSGRCPACRGRRLTAALDLDLLIARPNLPPSDEGFLTPPADKVLKGARRSTLLPYLKKLAAEGLWDPRRPFAAFDEDDRNLLLDGDWRRPGHGTFLKTPKSDPSEVSSWLRWNGLYREILDQADRSPDKAWLERLRSSCRMVACKSCGGSGLRAFAELLPAGDLNYRDWSLSAPAQQVGSLEKCNAASSPRAAAGLSRILACLAPKSQARIDAETVARRMIGAFTTLTAVEPTLPETD